MKLWRRKGVRNFLCWLLSAAFVWPSVVFVGAAGLAAKSASAQEVIKKPLVVVFDFSNRTNAQGALLGRQATDAVWVEMQRSGIFDMVSRDQLEQEVTLRDLRAPFDDTAMRMLAGALNATSYAYGSVLKAEVSEKGGTTEAVVRLELRIADRFSGELVNGAVAEATASRPGYTGPADLLLTEAVNKCASAIMGEVKARKMPVGQVLMVSKDDVLLNVGAAAGVKGGMRFVIYRSRGQEYDVVGHAIATEISNDDASARVTDNLHGIRSEDIARAVFEMPGTALSGTAKIDHTVKKAKHGFEKVILPLVAGLALWMLTKKSSDRTDPVRGLSGGAANEYDNGVYDLAGLNGPAAVLTWSKPAGQNWVSVLEYRIYRVPGSGMVYGGIPYSCLPVISDTDLRWWDVVPETPFAYRGEMATDIADPPVWPAPGNGTTAGMTPGQHYQYSVTAIYTTFLLDDVGAKTWRMTESSPVATATITPLDMNAGSGITVTPIQGSSQDLKDVQFRWLTVLGADIYAIQVSADITFPGNATWTWENIQKSPPAGRQVDLRVRNNTALISFAAADTERQLFWRVGGRYSRDNPGPVSGYVWSAPVSFTAQAEPPPPPD